MKSKIFSLTSVIIIMSILTLGGTYAWSSFSGTAHNKIEFGDLKIELVSELKAKQAEGNGDFVTEIKNIMPGSSFSSKVTVKNISGGHGAWVRVKVEPTWRSNGVKLNKNYKTYNEFKAAAYPAEYDFNVGDGAYQWTYNEGWFYYNSPIKPGECAKPLFTEVKFSAHGMGSGYIGSCFYIAFRAQGVQSENNADFEGAAWKDVKGWPSDNQ